MLKKYLLYAGLAIILAFVTNRIHENFFSVSGIYHECLDVSKNWEQQIRLEHEPCYVFAGGSEVRMNIEPITMLNEHGLHVINAGVTAGHGIRCNAQVALNFLKKGDTLVLSVVPGANDISKGVSHQGINLCYTRFGHACITEGIIPLFPDSFFYLFTGSTPHFSTQLVSALLQKKSRYADDNYARISPSGRLNLLYKVKKLPKQEITNTSGAGNKFIGWDLLIDDLKTACANREANLIVYISRGYTSPDLRKENALSALYITEMGIPVVKDAYLGAWPDEYYYSDTWLHLTIDGGCKFSSEIAALIKHKEYWTKEELLDIINSPS